VGGTGGRAVRVRRVARRGPSGLTGVGRNIGVYPREHTDPAMSGRRTQAHWPRPHPPDAPPGVWRSRDRPGAAPNSGWVIKCGLRPSTPEYSWPPAARRVGRVRWRNDGAAPVAVARGNDEGPAPPHQREPRTSIADADAGTRGPSRWQGIALCCQARAGAAPVRTAPTCASDGMAALSPTWVANAWVRPAWVGPTWGGSAWVRPAWGGPTCWRPSARDATTAPSVLRSIPRCPAWTARWCPSQRQTSPRGS
jgi:hypothetical protein